MGDGPILDTDVLIKVSCLHLAAEALPSLSEHGSPCALGAARFTARTRLSRSNRVADRAAALSELAALLASLSTVEPTPEEITLAGGFEQAANELGLPLDGGEGQVLAIVASRAGALMVTGDKRAIRAIEPVLAAAGLRGRCDGCVACLEQVISALLARYGAGELRRRVCGEPNCDKALANAFSCHGGGTAALADVEAGLGSYVRHLRADAPGVLFPGPSLSRRA